MSALIFDIPTPNSTSHQAILTFPRLFVTLGRPSGVLRDLSHGVRNSSRSQANLIGPSNPTSWVGSGPPPEVLTRGAAQGPWSRSATFGALHSFICQAEQSGKILAHLEPSVAAAIVTARGNTARARAERVTEDPVVLL